MADFSGLGQTGNTAAGGLEGRAKAAERFRTGGSDTTAETPPSPNYITWMHTLAPTREWNDVHHRIGDQPWDAASGAHQHLGGDGSARLFSADEVVSGDLSTPLGLEQAVKGILIALARRGLTDSTS
jgi:hypothetical protein